MISNTFARLYYASSHAKYGSFILAAAIALVVISFPSVLFQLHNPAPLIYEKEGMFSVVSLNTYFYPWLYKLSQTISLPMVFLLWVFKSLIYFISVICLTKTIYKVNKQIAVFSLFLLCLNVYFISYLPIISTDALYTTLFIFWMATVIHINNKLHFDKNVTQAYIFFPVALFLSGLLLAIRPDSIWISVTTIITLSFYLWPLYKLTKKKKIEFIGLLFLAALLIASVWYLFPLLHQSTLQMLYFGKLSTLPIEVFGKVHLQEGVLQMKYVSIFKNEESERYYYYINPFLHSEVANLQTLFVWYLKHPLDALITVMLKLVGAFNFDYITPHFYQLKYWYRWPGVVCALSIFYLGLWGIFSYLGNKTKNLFCGPRFFPIICLLGYSAMALLPLSELDVGLPLLALLLVFSIERILHAYNDANQASIINSVAIYLLAIFSLLLFLGWPYWTF